MFDYRFQRDVDITLGPENRFERTEGPGGAMRGYARRIKQGVLVAGVGLTVALSAAPAQASPSAQGLAHGRGAAASAQGNGLALGRPIGWDTGHRVS
jgi:hypothetical protein